MNKQALEKAALSIPPAPVQLKPPAKTGRPTPYTKKIADNILLQVSTTTKPIAEIANDNGISDPTLYNWIGINQEFFSAYLRALEIRSIAEVAGVDGLLSQLVDYIEHSNVDAREKHVRIQSLRLRIEQIRWKVSKHNRRLYGDKIEVDQQVTINPQDARADAWQLAQAAEYSVIQPANDNAEQADNDSDNVDN